MEKHHIVPKCIGGTNDSNNLIWLYGQLHYYAHKLLAEENPNLPGLLTAWYATAFLKSLYNDKYINISADEYALLKRTNSIATSIRMSQPDRRELQSKVAKQMWQDNNFVLKKDRNKQTNIKIRSS